MAFINYFKTKRKMNRKLRDTVFTKLFSEPKYAFELYKVFHPEDTEATESMIDIITLKHIFSDDIYNDLGILMNNRLMIFVEAQSSWNGNMAVRTLLYLSKTYQEYINKNHFDIMSHSPITLPKPEVYVIFTGERTEQPEYQKLSDHFVKNQDGIDSPLELKVKMIYNSDVKNIVGQYIEFCKIFDRQLKLHKKDKMLAIQKTLELCREQELLMDFISTHEPEVNTLMEDFIFNEKLLNKYHNENERRIAREEGLAEGIAKQKAEDEKIIHEKDAEIVQKDAELAQKDEEIARLKAQLAEKNN
ncbi:MAG: hypothetical protein MJ185_07170 [Treponema sp.]|nr:hypothetical protein [Treponema sp.]